MIKTSQCWCGSSTLLNYSPAYWHCKSCDTLVLKEWQYDLSAPVNDEGELYGKEYFLAHQQNGGLPSLYERTRTDLTDRIPYWLRTILKYRLPPASVLELGSSHGGFVAFMRWAGYEATGLDLSPWVTQFARETFGVPILQGTLESQKLDAASLDVIVHMDVLEHLPDPLTTSKVAVDALKPDGIMILQTPCFNPDMSYRDLAAVNHPFLTLLIPEHLYLFSKKSLQKLFSALGLAHLAFEPAFFSQYDIFAVISHKPLDATPAEEQAAALQTSPSGRLMLALLDLYQRAEDLQFHADARLKILQKQAAEMDMLRKVAQERLDLIQQLNKHGKK